ncbi:protein Loquacious-like isoform X4 [Epargyreus clarus]|uniref:protein Loquacious-like isoform X4 n=1 Tax=Epargyreus clarus TaxID=520877 RepID=UPI003C2C4BB2
MNKTPVTVLQELMVKFGDVPEYECIAQTGPQHQAVFEYCCRARGVTVAAAARSKKEAKQEAARRALAALAARGDPVPPPYCAAPAPPPHCAAPAAPAASAALALPSCSSAAGSAGADEAAGAGAEAGAGAGVDVRSYVALLKELCEEYKLGSVQYALVGDTGPPHLRRFTVSAALGSHERVATATTKKAARQLAAEQLYTYLREHLADATKDFVEEEALTRALDKAMSRYVELREEQPWRPDLGQRVADYHLGEERRREAVEADRAAAGEEDPVEALLRLAAALGLSVEPGSLPGERGPLSTVALGPAAPALVLAGRAPAAAAAAALRYLRRALRQNPAAIGPLRRSAPLNL